jgi:hypothetical protein
MDIYRAQRQYRPTASDIAGTAAPTDNWAHPTKGVMIYGLSNTAGGGTGVSLHLKGATTGLTFSFLAIVPPGRMLILPFNVFGSSSSVTQANRGIVGLY